MILLLQLLAFLCVWWGIFPGLTGAISGAIIMIMLEILNDHLKDRGIYL